MTSVLILSLYKEVDLLREEQILISIYNAGNDLSRPGAHRAPVAA